MDPERFQPRKYDLYRGGKRQWYLRVDLPPDEIEGLKYPASPLHGMFYWKADKVALIAWVLVFPVAPDYFSVVDVFFNISNMEEQKKLRELQNQKEVPLLLMDKSTGVVKSYRRLRVPLEVDRFFKQAYTLMVRHRWSGREFSVAKADYKNIQYVEDLHSMARKVSQGVCRK